MQPDFEIHSKGKLKALSLRLIQIKNLKLTMYDNKESLDKETILNIKAQLADQSEKIFKLTNNTKTKNKDQKELKELKELKEFKDHKDLLNN